jgi:hypothetical protein
MLGKLKWRGMPSAANKKKDEQSAKQQSPDAVNRALHVYPLANVLRRGVCSGITTWKALNSAFSSSSKQPSCFP